MAVAVAAPPTKHFQIPTPQNVNYFQIWSARGADLNERERGRRAIERGSGEHKPYPVANVALACYGDVRK